MAAIVVCGAGPIGLCAAMMLARDGHAVTVVERDPAPVPSSPLEAWDTWNRRGVAQFHQPHNLFPRFRQVLEAELPGMVDRLAGAGCLWIDALILMPPFISDRSPRPDDDKFRFVTGRRPVVEAVLARAAEEHDGVTVRRGISITGLMSGTPVVDGVPHVTGIRTTDGEPIEADLVVDTMGRRTKVGEWLSHIGGGSPATDSEDCGFTYYTQYFTGPHLPALKGPPIAELGTFSLLTIPGDNRTWSVTLWVASADTRLKGLRDRARFAAVVRACPWHRHWIDAEPITGVLAMGGILDRHRRFVVDGVPVVTGLAAVGDASVCTNPSAGRGMSVGLIHAQALREVVRATLDDPEAFALAWDDATETRVAPYYWDQVKADRARLAEMNALREGRTPPPPDPMVEAAWTASLHDADVFRGLTETRMCLALPEEVFARPGFMEKVHAAGGAPRLTVPGPDRARLLDLVLG